MTTGLIKAGNFIPKKNTVPRIMKTMKQVMLRDSPASGESFRRPDPGLCSCSDPSPRGAALGQGRGAPLHPTLPPDPFLLCCFQ